MMPDGTDQPAQYRVAADIGGTFTDLVFQDLESGRCRALKTLSTPENPAIAVLDGIRKGLRADDRLDLFIHGTNVGLNALLTRRGARVALLTTGGFRDIYTIQGNDRGEIFSIRWKKPPPLVSVKDTFTVPERIAADGSVVVALDVSTLDPVIEALRAADYDAIAICFLFSFLNPSHEREAAAYIRAALPGVDITLSHEVSPEWREFDRISTTVMSAFTAPVVRRYLGPLVETRTGGSGGFGTPLARPFAEIQEDLDCGWITPAVAERDYGAVVQDGVVDVAASKPRIGA